LPYGFAESCVCIKQSSEPLCCGLFRLPGASPGHPTKATLIPKLRVHFAEFLRDGSLARLRILSSPTCVGLRYGWLQFSLAGFPDSRASDTRVPSEDFPRPSPLGLNDSPDLPKESAYEFRPDKPASGCHSFLYYRIVITNCCQRWNVDQLSIAYAFRPPLRTG
jgi:hypothetical protein